MAEIALFFTKVAEGIYHCPAKSHPGERYVLSVMDNGDIFCTCEGSMRRGADTCKHARGLRGYLDQQAT